MKKLLLAALFAALPFSIATADLKVALIDVNKVANAYYKAKDVTDKLKAKQDENNKSLESKIKIYTSTGKEAEMLQKATEDPTLSQSARDEKKKAFDSKKEDLLALEHQLKEMKTEQDRELQDQFLRLNRDIFDEIDKVATDYANAQGYDLVLQRTFPGGAMMVLHNSSKIVDITDTIISTMNKNAPAGSAPTGAAPTGAASNSSAPAPKQ